MNTLIHQLYDLHSSMAYSDFIGASQLIRTARYKRSLVVLVSNVQEDESDLVAAAKLLMQHLVLIASLREETLDECLSAPLNNSSDTFNMSGLLIICSVGAEH